MRLCWNRDVIHPFGQPFKDNAGIAVLRGGLAPDGAVIKISLRVRTSCSIAGVPLCSSPSKIFTRASMTKISTSMKTQ